MEPHHTIDGGKQNSESNTNSTYSTSVDRFWATYYHNECYITPNLSSSLPSHENHGGQCGHCHPFLPSLLLFLPFERSSLWKGKGGALIRYSPYAPSVGTCIISIIPLSQMGGRDRERQMTNRCIFLGDSIICDTSPFLGDLFDFIFWQPNLMSST